MSRCDIFKADFLSSLDSLCLDVTTLRLIFYPVETLYV